MFLFIFFLLFWLLFWRFYLSFFIIFSYCLTFSYFLRFLFVFSVFFIFSALWVALPAVCFVYIFSSKVCRWQGNFKVLDLHQDWPEPRKVIAISITTIEVEKPSTVAVPNKNHRERRTDRRLQESKSSLSTMTIFRHLLLKFL